jgi:hypothetical protein
VKILKTLAFAAAMTLAGCAETQPYVSTHIVGNYQLNWFSDGPPLSINVYNPTPVTVSGNIACIGGDETVRYPLTLPPHGEFHALGRVLNRDAIFDPCWWEPTP